MRFLPILPPLLLLAACNGLGGMGGGRDATSPADGSHPRNYAGVGEGEVLHFTGTEPFWGGSVAGSVTGGVLTYTTPEDPKGVAIAVRRFAGNNGLGFSGMLGGKAFDMTVAEAPCSDGMSDRRYPFTVTLLLGGETRRGCGWTDRRPASGPAQP